MSDPDHTASLARVWNYLQGGSHHRGVDRAVGEAVVAGYPDAFRMARECQLFLARAVRHVAVEHGIRQFLHLGCLLPAPAGLRNVHDVAQEVHPDARVVYVDDDPAVVERAETYRTPCTPEGVCAFLELDPANAAHVFDQAAATLDLDRPIAVILFGLLGSLDFERALELRSRVLDVVSGGSSLIFEDGTSTDQRRAVGSAGYHLREPKQMARYFLGLELVSPGLVSVTNWRPDGVQIGTVRPVAAYGAVARKPLRSTLPGDYFQAPSVARMWNYLQGGRDNIAVDRRVGDAMAKVDPDVFRRARQCRRFLDRALRHLAAEAGARQFLDLGCGLPAPSGMRNVHEVVQDIHPAARVVYVDNDPVVFSHARALLAPANEQGVCGYLEADARRVEFVLAEAGKTLDLAQPVVVIMLGLLGGFELEEGKAVVRRVMAGLPSGSWLLFDDGANTGEVAMAGMRGGHAAGLDTYVLRTAEQMAEYFIGLELLEPGLVPVNHWRPELAELADRRPVDAYGAVARKPELR